MDNEQLYIFSLYLQSASETSCKHSSWNQLVTSTTLYLIRSMSLPFEDSKVPYSNPLSPITYRHESTIILYGGMVRAINISYRSGFGITLAMSIVILTFAGTGGQLTPRRVFTVLSLVTALRRTNFNFFVRALFQVSELRVAQVRIKVRSRTLSRLLLYEIQQDNLVFSVQAITLVLRCFKHVL